MRKVGGFFESFMGIALVCGLLFSASPAHAGPLLNDWTEIGPWGGDRHRVIIDPVDPQILYTVMITLHKSTDGGENWFSIDKMTPGSSDLMGLLSYSLCIDPSEHEVLYTGTMRGVYKSLNGGSSWVEVNEGIPESDRRIRDVVVDEGDSQIVYASISKITPFAAPGTGQDIEAAIYRSLDGGATWDSFDTGISYPYTDITTIYQNPLTLELFAATLGDGLYKYDVDLGEWAPANNGLSVPLGLEITELAFDPNAGDTLYACTRKDWVYKSIDGGDSWDAIPYPFALEDPYPPMAYYLAVDPNNSDCVWVSAFPGNDWSESAFYKADLDQDLGGLFVSQDGGMSWEDCQWPDIIKDTGPYGIAIDPSEVTGNGPSVRSKTYYMTSGGIYCIWKSSDGGATYDRKVEGLAALTSNAISQHPADGSVFFTTDEGAVEFSFDRGDNWIYLSPVTAGGLIYIWDVVGDPSNPDLMYYATGQPDWGRPDFRGLYAVDLSAVDPDSTFHQGPGDMLPSTQGIGIWRAYPKGSGKIFLATQDDGVLKSVDNGNTWTSMSSGLGIMSVTSLVFDADQEPLVAGTRAANGDPENPYLLNPDGEEGAVYRWDSDYQSWSRAAETEVISAVYSVRNLESDPQTIYLTTNEGVFRSEDGGATWQEKSWGLPKPLGNFNAHDIAIHPDDPNLLFVTSWTLGVYSSSDGGEHWTAFNQELYQYNMHELIIDWELPSVVYAATAATSIQKCVTGKPPVVDTVTANSVPLSAPYGVSIHEEELLEVFIEGHDPDGGTVTYSARLNLADVPAPSEVEDPDLTFTFDPETQLFRWSPLFGTESTGPYELTLQVSDGAMSAYIDVQIDIEPIHSPEVVSITSDGVPLIEPYTTSVVEEEFFEVQIEASDADGDTLTYSATVNAVPVPAPWEVEDPDTEYTFDPTTRIFRWAPPVGYSEFNPYQLNFIVTDGRFTISPVVMFDIEPIHPPEVDWITSDGFPLTEPYTTLAGEEEFFEVQVQASDADGDALTYSATVNGVPVLAPWEVEDPDAEYTFDTNTRIFRWAPPAGYSQFNPYQLNFIITDGRFTISPVVMFDIEPIHPPHVDWITSGGFPLTEPYTTSVVEEQFLEVQIEASDSDGDTLTYSATVNGVPVLAPWEAEDPDTEYTFDPTTRIFRWAPPHGYGEFSPYQLNFIITDGRFTIAPKVMFDIEPIHEPEVDWITSDGVPLIEPYTTSVVEEEFFEVQIEASDADGDTLTYSATVNAVPVPAPWEAEDPDTEYTFDPTTRIFRWAPPYGYSEFSPYQLNFIVTDGRFTISPVVMFDVEPIHPPEVDWITSDGVPLTEPYTTSVVEEEFIEVQIEASDADGDTITYAAMVNAVPVPAPWEVEDPDAEYTFDPTTRIFRWAPPVGYSQFSPFQLNFEVTDGRFTIYPLVMIDIEPLHPPEVDWITSDGVPLTEPYTTSVVEEQFFEIQIQASDADGDTITYSATVNAVPVPAPWEVEDPDTEYTFDPTTRIFRWAPPHGYGEFSPYQLNFIVTDGLFTISPVVMFDVEPIHPPEVDWITSDGIPLTEPYTADATEEQFFELQIEASDADGDMLIYSAFVNMVPVPAPWEVEDPNTEYTFDPTTRIFRWAPPVGYSQFNPFLLNFEVTDGRFTIYPVVSFEVNAILPPEVDWITADGVPLTEPFTANVVEEEFIEVQILASDADGDRLFYDAMLNGEYVPAPWEVPNPDEEATFDPYSRIFRWAPPNGYSAFSPHELHFEVSDGRFTIYPNVEITAEPNYSIDFSLEMDAAFVAGELLLDFTLAAPEATVWEGSLLVWSTRQVYPLWSEALPALLVPVDLPSSHNIPNLGLVAIQSTLSVGGEVKASDIAWVRCRRPGSL